MGKQGENSVVQTAAVTGKQGREASCIGDVEAIPAATITRALGAISNAGGMDVLNAARGEVGVLGYLVGHGGAATPSALGEALHVSSGRVANTLKMLERKSYIVRETNPEDGRGVIVRITPAGKAFGEASFADAVRVVSELIGPLSPEERVELAKLVDRVAEPLVR